VIPQRLLRSDAARIWTAALSAVDPQAAVRKLVRCKGRMLQVERRRVDLSKVGNIWVIGAGKAAASMGHALEKIIGGRLSGGVLVTKYGHGLPLKKIDIIEAGHPLPDENSVAAAVRIVSLANNQIRHGDLVFCLISGGGSALLAAPAEGITLEDKILCTSLLLNAGATIHEVNAVRKHLSSIKGGGLARLLAPACVVCLVLSDVVGDDLGTIASGPTVPDRTTFTECLEIFRTLRICERVPAAVIRRLELGASGKLSETPKAGDRAFQNVSAHIIGSGSQACTAAARKARRLGYGAMVLTSRLEGDNRAAALFHMSVASEIVFQGRPLRRPACLISGGETTVSVTGKGIGGRNQEFALHCARHLAQLSAPALVASIGTDGTDGPTDAAGAISDNTTVARSLRYGACFLSDSLESNDSYRFFQRLGDLIITGPTGTNVMDLHIVLIG